MTAPTSTHRGKSAAAIPPPTSQAELLRRGRILECLTLGWNAVEAVVAVGSGLLAGSTALLGFGIDSLIESSSGGILLWRLQEAGAREREKRERLALKLVGVSFLALAAWVGWDALNALLRQDVPDESYVGIVLAALSLLVMPILAHRKRSVAEALGSRALEADSRQTDLCAYLSAILLLGLVLNAALGWWWADPVAGLAMIPIISKEGASALRGQVCQDCHLDLQGEAE
ncbi:cation diffusion facilitator family transporter [Gemmatimonadota bacterium]